MSLDRLLLPFAAAAILLLGTTTAALAKCEHGDAEMCEEVVASVNFSGTPRAGSEIAVSVWLTRGDEPYNAKRVELTFVQIDGGRVITFPAAETSTLGQYQARVTLPNGGGWTVLADIAGYEGTSGDTFRQQVTTLRALAPLAAPQTPNAPVTPATPAPITLPWVWIPLLAAAMLSATALVVRRARRRTAVA